VCRTWIKELQTVRNKWAHLSAGTMPDGEMYRDADTLGRLLTTIGPPDFFASCGIGEVRALSRHGLAPEMAVPAMTP